MFIISSPTLLRGLSFFIANFLWLFLLNVYLLYWHNWTPLSHLFNAKLTAETNYHFFQLAAIATLAVLSIWWARNNRSLNDDALLFSKVSAFIIRTTFWSVVFIGIADALISMLRVEGILDNLVDEQLAKDLGKPSYRGQYVHFPLILLGIAVASITRGFVAAWLALLVVLAEFQIVIWRFVFSYEQAYMGDLVRFWYAGLFLFTSAYTLVNEGHVRVDVLYAHFEERKKAMVNLLGSLLLGLPLCWIILMQGMSGKGAALVSPLLSFEISQSSFGMYVKYLMSTYLIVFATSMALQFISVMLRASALLNDHPLDDDPQYDPESHSSDEFHSEPIAEL